MRKDGFRHTEMGMEGGLAQMINRLTSLGRSHYTRYVMKIRSRMPVGALDQICSCEHDIRSHWGPQDTGAAGTKPQE